MSHHVADIELDNTVGTAVASMNCDANSGTALALHLLLTTGLRPLFTTTGD